MYLNEETTSNKIPFTRLTVTLDVFKYVAELYPANFLTWLTVTLDVFKSSSVF